VSFDDVVIFRIGEVQQAKTLLPLGVEAKADPRRLNAVMPSPVSSSNSSSSSSSSSSSGGGGGGGGRSCSSIRDRRRRSSSSAFCFHPANITLFPTFIFIIFDDDDDDDGDGGGGGNGDLFPNPNPNPTLLSEYAPFHPGGRSS